VPQGRQVNPPTLGTDRLAAGSGSADVDQEE
jgi:hypothetical protein